MITETLKIQDNLMSLRGTVVHSMMLQGFKPGRNARTEDVTGWPNTMWKGRGSEQGGSPEVRCMPQCKEIVAGEQLWGSYAPLWYNDSSEDEGKVVRGGNNIFITR